MGGHRKDLTKEQILEAMDATKSVRSACRYLKCSYQHLKMWMKFYKGEDGRTLFEIHKNPSGKGIPKFMSDKSYKGREPAVLDIIEGRTDASHLDPQRIKYRLIEFGYIKEECYKCGFHEHRIMDNKIPLIMHFKNGNKSHYKLDNLQMLCYNCYFLFFSNVFTEKELTSLEDHVPHYGSTELDDKLEIDEYTRERLDQLGLFNTKENDSPYDLVSYR